MTDTTTTRTEVAQVARGLELCPDVPRSMPLDKRLLDIVGSFIGLLLLAPLFGALALLISLDSPGGAIYRQRRVGLGGSTFDFYKFRTMYADNDPGAHRAYVQRLILQGSHDLCNSNGSYKMENDPRITRVGAVLRRFSLDELPQLLNVFAGDMSLVGPRPPLEYEYDLYTPRQRCRLGVVPGMTGLWQVSGRNETTFEEMIDLDLEYVERRSMLLDLKILAKTPLVVMEAGGS